MKIISPIYQLLSTDVTIKHTKPPYLITLWFSYHILQVNVMVKDAAISSLNEISKNSSLITALLKDMWVFIINLIFVSLFFVCLFVQFSHFCLPIFVFCLFVCSILWAIFWVIRSLMYDWILCFLNEIVNCMTHWKNLSQRQ